LERDLIVALARVPRGDGAGDNSLIRALADDLKLGFDPLTAKLGTSWTGPIPAQLPQPSPSPLRGGIKGGGVGPSPDSLLAEAPTPPPRPRPSPQGGGRSTAASGANLRTIGDLVEHL